MKAYRLRKEGVGYWLTCNGKTAFLYYYAPERTWYGYPTDVDGHQLEDEEADHAYRKEWLIETLCQRLEHLRNPLPSFSFVPPQRVAKVARQGLRLRELMPPSRRGGTSVGIRRAVQLANRQPVSVSTLKRMRSYFQRHAVDARAAGWGADSKGWQAWLLWGGYEAQYWCNLILNKLGE
jgi:hypothetical protein